MNFIIRWMIFVIEFITFSIRFDDIYMGWIFLTCTFQQFERHENKFMNTNQNTKRF